MSGYYRQYCERFRQAGLDPIPIKPGHKHPDTADWRNRKFSPARYGEWGIGNKCDRIGALDCDVRDQAASQAFLDWLQDEYEIGPVRTGAPPKWAILVTNNYGKKRQVVYVDPEGEEHKLEFLGEGQQLVIQAIHPDTGQPYNWHGEEPDDGPWPDLDVDEVIAAFCRIMEAHGFTRKGGTNGGSHEAGEWESMELWDLLQGRDPDTDYDEWVQVGMSLHHETGGSAAGLKMWDAWSSQGSKYKPGECESKWGTFKSDREKVVTGGSLRHKARKRRPLPDLKPLTVSEMDTARDGPREIVKDYLFADVAAFFAPGSTGKTTQVLYEHACIATGRPIFGQEVLSPGYTLFVTAEDDREYCAYRLGRLTENWSPAERQQVAERVFIWDMPDGMRKLVEHGESRELVVAALAEQMVEAWSDIDWQVITFDPLISFGADEERVNANMQALVEAARVIRRGMDCCVRLVHHTGQEAARSKNDDMYVGRGGTALSDGSRMISSLTYFEGTEDGALYDFPHYRLTRSKLTFRARQPKLYYSRDGWELEVLETVEPEERDQMARLEHEQMILQRVGQGDEPTKARIEEYFNGTIARSEVRGLVEQLLTRGRIKNVGSPSRPHFALADTGQNGGG